jgi:prepilin-type processing-associated H-X9-DG protein
MWDVPNVTRDEIVALGAGRKAWYCTTNWEHNIDANWNRGSGDSYVGYFSFIRRIGGNYPALPPTQPVLMKREPKLEYRTRVLAQKFPQDAELFMDAVVGNGAPATKYIDVTGNQGVPRSTNHMERALPWGANVAYMDGHVEPIRWPEMKKFYVIGSNIYFFMPGQ